MTARWLYQGKISPKSMLETISERQAGYGIAAIVWKDGYDKYGSYHYTSVMEDGVRPTSCLKRSSRHRGREERTVHE